jgi:ankyrin repeat protein
MKKWHLMVDIAEIITVYCTMSSTTFEQTLRRSQTTFIHLSFPPSYSFFLCLPLPSNPLVQDGLTALLMAAQNGHWEVVSTLLDGGADASIASEVRTYVHTDTHTYMNT